MQPIRTFSTLILLLTLVITSHAVLFLPNDKTQKPQEFNTLFLQSHSSKHITPGQITNPQPTKPYLFFYHSGSEALFLSQDLTLVDQLVKNLRRKGLVTRIEAHLENHHKNGGIYETGSVFVKPRQYYAVKCEYEIMLLIADEYRDMWELTVPEPLKMPETNLFSRFTNRLNTKSGSVESRQGTMSRLTAKKQPR